MEYLPDFKTLYIYSKLYRQRFSEKEFIKFSIIDSSHSISLPYFRLPNTKIHCYNIMHSFYFHNRYGPARIQYSSDGERISEEYWIRGKQKSYKEFLQFVKASRYSRK